MDESLLMAFCDQFFTITNVAGLTNTKQKVVMLHAQFVPLIDFVQDFRDDTKHFSLVVNFCGINDFLRLVVQHRLVIGHHLREIARQSVQFFVGEINLHI
jgi:hypothetical protein